MHKDTGRGEFSNSPCPPEVRTIIDRMGAIMSTDRRYNHAGVPTQIAIDLIKAGMATSFAEFEGWLRELDSRVHFIGVPLDFYGPKWADKTVNPFDPEDMPEYTLWAGVNGEEEATAMLEQLGITPDENSQRLLSVGVLSVG